MFNQSIITLQGLELDAKIRAGSAAAIFTSVKLGDGTYTGTEYLEEAQELKSVRQVLKISSISLMGEKTVRVRAVTGNAGVTNGYYITEIGVYAQDPDAGEILYSIATGTEGKPDYQPSEAEIPNQTGLFEYYIAVSNAETATIQLGTGAMAAAEDLLEKVDIKGGDISDTIIGALEESTEEFPVPTVGESAKTVFGKIIKFIQDSNAAVNLINHVTTIILTAAGWAGSAAPYTQTVSVPGVTSEMEPILVSALAEGATEAVQKAYVKAFGIICSGTGTTGDGTATFKVYKKPATDCTVGLKGG